MIRKFADVLAIVLIVAVMIAIGHAAQNKGTEIARAERNADNTGDVPALSEATKIKGLLAQHDFDNTQVRYAQLQQQFQQQQAQLNQEAQKEFAALEALKEAAYTEAHADKSAWTLTDKWDFIAAPKRPAAPDSLSGKDTPPTPAAKQ